MANLQQRLPENVPGDFFVDSTCIDCDTCSQLAPSIFRDHGDQCSVYRQPETVAETRRAMMALVACPTGSIGATRKHDAHIGIDAFPMHIGEDVYFCGFTAEASFGGWSYLITRRDSAGGNVMIDSPRFAIPTPGHTRGHVVFLYKQKFLFIGDHPAWSPTRNTLTAFRSVAWYSWPAQIRSMEKLLAYDFGWVLPGHGDMHHDTPEKMHEHLERCVVWMKTRN